ncbi:MAG: CpsB/CapC family capsule biosynthesis tyrosine phosphatase [Bacillota bacterium]
MIDIHAHILPGVDDGSQSIEVSIQMIKKEIADGVTAVILTPHVQSRVSKLDPKEHLAIFENLQEEVKRQGLAIDLYLGAEIFYRSHIDTKYRAVSLNDSKYVLLEFSPSIETPIEEIVYDVSRQGYIPIIAHVERYYYLEFEDYYKIKATGALLQVNTTAILNLDDFKIKKGLIHKLLKNHLVDFIATDTHGMGIRQPNMRETYDYLMKQYDEDYLKDIFESNARKIIESN